MIVARKIRKSALGDGIKVIEDNEKKSIIVQRRSIRASKHLKKRKNNKKNDMVFLRPCPKNFSIPIIYKKLIGKKTKRILCFMRF